MPELAVDPGDTGDETVGFNYSQHGPGRGIDLMAANAANTGTLRNVETIIGGTGADTITLGPPSPTARSISVPATTG